MFVKPYSRTVAFIHNHKYTLKELGNTLVYRKTTHHPGFYTATYIAQYSLMATTQLPKTLVDQIAFITYFLICILVRVFLTFIP